MKLSEEIWARIEPFVIAFGAQNINISAESNPQRHERDIEGIWDACGSNPHLLISRYGPGGHFAPHTDGYSVIDLNHRSMYSVIVYLNTCLPSAGDGGTRFYSDAARGTLMHEGLREPVAGTTINDSKLGYGERITADRSFELCTVAAVAGRVCVFYHNIFHEGTPPAPAMSKYIIRSDLMYKRRDPICNKPEDIEAYELYRRAVDVAGIAGKEKEAVPLFQKAFRLSRALADLYGM